MDRPFAVRRASDGAMFYYSQELPGHVAGLINTADQAVNTYEYDPWGQALTTSEQVPQPERYGAREYDSETGFYYVRARYYDPQVGRFMSQDPIGLAGGINTYAYVGDDPVNGRDPSGTCALIVIKLEADGSWSAWCESGGGGGDPYWESHVPGSYRGDDLAAAYGPPNGVRVGWDLNSLGADPGVCGGGFYGMCERIEAELAFPVIALNAFKGCGPEVSGIGTGQVTLIRRKGIVIQGVSLFSVTVVYEFTLAPSRLDPAGFASYTGPISAWDEDGGFDYNGSAHAFAHCASGLGYIQTR